MKAYIVTCKATGRVEEAFLGNGDELTPLAFDALRARLEKHGFTVVIRQLEPVKPELTAFVEQVERDDY